MYNSTGTDFAPTISMNFDTGLFRIEGKSVPENPWDVYQPVLDALAAYRKQPAPQTVLEVHLEFFNTSSSKMLLDLIALLEKMHLEAASQVTVKWCYTDEDMMEIGEDFKFLMKVPFELIDVGDGLEDD